MVSPFDPWKPPPSCVLCPCSTWRPWGPTAPVAVLSHSSLGSKQEFSQAECPTLQQRLPLAWGSTPTRGQCPPWQPPPAKRRPCWQACLPPAWVPRPCSSPPPSVITAFYVSSEPPPCPCPAASPPPLLPLLPPPRPPPLHPPPWLLPCLPPLPPLSVPLPSLLRFSSAALVALTALSSTTARTEAARLWIRTSPLATLNDEEKEDEDMGEFKHHFIMNHKEKRTTLWKFPAFFNFPSGLVGFILFLFFLTSSGLT